MQEQRTFGATVWNRLGFAGAVPAQGRHLKIHHPDGFSALWVPGL